MKKYLLSILLLLSVSADALEIVEVENQDELNRILQESRSEYESYINSDQYLDDINNDLNDKVLNYSNTVRLEEIDEDKLREILGNRVRNRKDITSLYHQYDLEIYEGEGKYIPLPLENADLVKLMLSTSLGVIAMNYDREIMRFIQDHKNENTETVAEYANHMGHITGIGPIAIGSYFFGMVFKDKKLQSVGLYTVGAALATQLVNSGLKDVFGRERPYKSELSNPYQFFRGGTSFPSGHTTGAFSLATVISEIYKEDYPIIPYIAYGVASATAYARMHDQKHWASDVIVAGILSHLITKYFIKFFRKQLKDHEKSYLKIYPLVRLSGDIGIGFEVKL